MVNFLDLGGRITLWVYNQVDVTWAKAFNKKVKGNIFNLIFRGAKEECRNVWNLKERDSGINLGEPLLSWRQNNP